MARVNGWIMEGIERHRAAEQRRQFERSIQAMLDRSFPAGSTRFYDTTRQFEDTPRFELRTGRFFTEGRILWLGRETRFEDVIEPAILRVAQAHFLGLAHERGGYS